MKSKASLGILFVTATFAASPAFAQQQPSMEAAEVIATVPGAAVADSVVTVTAIVEAIDRSERIVTLKGPEGNQIRVLAGPEVRNFDQIEVGDELVVTHVESVSLELIEGGDGIRERIETESAERAPAGDMPGATGERVVVIIANVLEVDPEMQIVTLRGPEKIVKIRLADPEQFALVEVGDQVRAEITEAVAISMEPAQEEGFVNEQD